MASSSRRKLQIFVSSTYRDLIKDRQAAVSAILKAGHIPAGMELFNAGDRSQLETIKRWIDESDIFMLILGGRYGSLEPESKLSYTEVEYNYALETKKPFFAVVIHEDTLKERSKLEGPDVLELEEPQKLKAFRGKVESKICTYFSDVSDIKLTVHESIPDLEQRHSLTGWIRAETAPDTTGLVNEISRLTQENTKLGDELKHARELVSREANLGETELRHIARSLAESEFKMPPTSHHYRALFANKLANVDQRLREIFTDSSKLPEYDQLIVFFALCGDLLNGIASNSGDTISRLMCYQCANEWVLQEIVDVKTGPERIHELTSKGRKLYSLLNSAYKTLPAR